MTTPTQNQIGASIVGSIQTSLARQTAAYAAYNAEIEQLIADLQASEVEEKSAAEAEQIAALRAKLGTDHD